MRTEAELVFSGRDRTRAAFNSVTNSTRRAASQIARAGSLISAAFGVGLIAGLVRTSSAIDDLGKTADRLGIATESLQAFRVASEESGVAQATLTTGVRTSQRAISESIRGLETYAVAFRQLNLDTEELARQSPEEAFRTIGAAIGNVDNQFQRAAISQQIFGRAGNELLNVFRDISVLDDAAQFIDDFNLGLSRIEVQRVEAANDAFARVGTVLTNIGNQISVRVAPFLQAFSETLLDSVRNSDLLETSLDNAFDRLPGILGTIANLTQRINIAWTGTRLAVTGFALVVSEAFIALDSGARTVGNVLLNSISAPFRLGIQAVEGFLGALSRIPGIGNVFSEAAEQAERFRVAIADPIPERQAGFLDDFSRNAAMQFVELQESYRRITSEPLPSDQIDSFFNRFIERAEEIRNQGPISRITQGNFDFEGLESGALEERNRRQEQLEQERQQRELSRLQERFRLIRAENEGQLALELEQERIQFEERQLVLDELAALEIERRAEINTEKENLEAEHQQRISDIIQRDMDRVAAEERRQQQQRQQGLSSFFGNLQSITQSGGERLFRISKAIEIAQALLAARESIVEAYKHGNRIGGPPVGAAFAAVAAAATAAQIAAIRSTSISSSGSASSQAGGAATPVAEQLVPQIADPITGQTRTANISVRGSVFSREQLLEITEGLSELFEDGDINLTFLNA